MIRQHDKAKNCTIQLAVTRSALALADDFLRLAKTERSGRRISIRWIWGELLLDATFPGWLVALAMAKNIQVVVVFPMDEAWVSGDHYVLLTRMLLNHLSRCH
jgi:signal transduction histidine kinase